VFSAIVIGVLVLPLPRVMAGPGKLKLLAASQSITEHHLREASKVHGAEVDIEVRCARTRIQELSHNTNLELTTSTYNI